MAIEWNSTWVVIDTALGWPLSWTSVFPAQSVSFQQTEWFNKISWDTLLSCSTSFLPSLIDESRQMSLSQIVTLGTIMLEPVLGVKHSSPYWVCAVSLARWQLNFRRLHGYYLYALLILKGWQLELGYWYLDSCESLAVVHGQPPLNDWWNRRPQLCARWHSTTSTTMRSSLVNQPISNRRAGYYLATFGAA